MYHLQSGCLVVLPDLLGLCCLVRKPSLTWCLVYERLRLIIRINDILVVRGLQLLDRLRILAHLLLLIGSGEGLQLRLHCAKGPLRAERRALRTIASIANLIERDEKTH